MFKTLILLLLAVLFCVCSFWLGMWWKGKTLGEATKFELTSPVSIQVSPEQIGSLPVGTVIYQYPIKIETPIYYMFLQLKERDILKSYRGKNRDKYNLIVPVWAYPIEHNIQ
ncbi:MAG: hypothetical protein VSS75_015725 [Candidatus Parabeggiatoa sp.]|nr:hypothetical protein [Candidatus Parabeggiatoa sp.]